MSPPSARRLWRCCNSGPAVSLPWPQGINAQYGGGYDDAVAYAKWLDETQPLFKASRLRAAMLRRGALLKGHAAQPSTAWCKDSN